MRQNGATTAHKKMQKCAVRAVPPAKAERKQRRAARSASEDARARAMMRVLIESESDDARAQMFVLFCLSPAHHHAARKKRGAR